MEPACFTQRVHSALNVNRAAHQRDRRRQRDALGRQPPDRPRFGLRGASRRPRGLRYLIDSSWSAYPQRSARTIHALVDAYLAAHHYVQRGRVYVRPDLIGPANDAPLKPATTDVTFDGK